MANFKFIKAFIFGILAIAIACMATTTKPAQVTSFNSDTSYITSTQKLKSDKIPDSTEWTASFLELREAITTGDREAVKSFIDFPVRNKDNEIWYLADLKFVREISPKEIKPFTESDFDKYFSSIFPIDLRRTFEKLNVTEFFRTNKSITPEIEVVKDTKSKLMAQYDNTASKLTLTLSTTGEGFTAFIVMYEFDIRPDQKIKFRQVHIDMS